MRGDHVSNLSFRELKVIDKEVLRIYTYSHVTATREAAAKRVRKKRTESCPPRRSKHAKATKLKLQGRTDRSHSSTVGVTATPWPLCVGCVHLPVMQLIYARIRCIGKGYNTSAPATRKRGRQLQKLGPARTEEKLATRWLEDSARGSRSRENSAPPSRQHGGKSRGRHKRTSPLLFLLDDQ